MPKDPGAERALRDIRGATIGKLLLMAIAGAIACSATGSQSSDPNQGTGGSAGLTGTAGSSLVEAGGSAGSGNGGGVAGQSGAAGVPNAGGGGTSDSLGTGDVVDTHVTPAGKINPAADAAIDAYNKAFLVTAGGGTFYKMAINNGSPDVSWTASLDMLAAEDAYERTGSAAHKMLVGDLCSTWLKNTPPPWDADGWNDDIGWYTLALIRGYQMTGKSDFLTAAKNGFDMAWARGWDTQYNGGGIWEIQPNLAGAGDPVRKEALSNDTLGKVACLIYQSTHEQSYLDRAIQIYVWVKSHIYNSATGQVYAGIEKNDAIVTGYALYSQGTFVDYAMLLYELTGDVKYYDDALSTIEYVKTQMTTNGVLSTDLDFDSWADEFARGLGRFVRDSGQWATYYPWFTQNATSIQAHRRTDYGITWNGWALQTPSDDSLITTKFASAVAWLQFTPATRPDSRPGLHYIVSKQDGLAIDNDNQVSAGAGIVQATANGAKSQRWLITQNDDTSWNIINTSSWKALAVPDANKAIGTQMIQATPTRDDNQRWWIDVQDDGSFEISNKATGGALVNIDSSMDCPAAGACPVVQSTSNGGNRQRWLLRSLTGWTKRTFEGTEDNAAEPAEWDLGAYKGDCGSGEAATGLSTEVSAGSPHALLCSNLGSQFSGNAVTTLSDVAGGAHRRATRGIAAVGPTDWDLGYYESECGSNEYVSGVSQLPSGKIHGLRCASAPMTGNGSAGCETRFVLQDDRGNTETGDWDGGEYKGECAAGKVVVGVSASMSTGKPHKVLCCSQ